MHRLSDEQISNMNGRLMPGGNLIELFSAHDITGKTTLGKAFVSRVYVPVDRNDPNSWTLHRLDDEQPHSYVLVRWGHVTLRTGFDNLTPFSVYIDGEVRFCKGQDWEQAETKMLEVVNATSKGEAQDKQRPAVAVRD